MAHDLGLKVFQVYRPTTDLGFEFTFDMDDIDEIVVPAIKKAGMTVDARICQIVSYALHGNGKRKGRVG